MYSVPIYVCDGYVAKYQGNLLSSLGIVYIGVMENILLWSSELTFYIILNKLTRIHNFPPAKSLSSNSLFQNNL